MTWPDNMEKQVKDIVLKNRMPLTGGWRWTEKNVIEVNLVIFVDGRENTVFEPWKKMIKALQLHSTNFALLIAYRICHQLVDPFCLILSSLS